MLHVRTKVVLLYGLIYSTVIVIVSVNKQRDISLWIVVTWKSYKTAVKSNDCNGFQLNVSILKFVSLAT